MAVWNQFKPAASLLGVQMAITALNVMLKLAVDDGMNSRILVAYRYIFASATLIPLALIFERNRAKITWTVLFQAFLCGLFGGVLTQNFYLEALNLTSATFASAMSNLLPAVTFILAVAFRLERLNLKTREGKAKAIGTIIGIGGAMILTFFKGTKIDTGSFHVTRLQHHGGHVASPQSSPSGDSTLLGALSSLGSVFSYALWLIIQGKMSQRYPYQYSSTALMSLTASLISIVLALCLDRDWAQWRLGWNIRLLAAAYSGMVGSGVMVVVMAWCVHMRGPLYVSAFNPLLVVFVALACCFMLGENLYLGSVIGGLLIVSGLYVVLWGKAREGGNLQEITQQEINYQQ